MSNGSPERIGNLACPECEGDVPLTKGDVVGSIIPCPDCGEEFEVRGEDKSLTSGAAITVFVLPSLRLKPAPIIEEDMGE